MICKVCREEDDDLRAGICFDCATEGECKSACRTVAQHIRQSIYNVWRRRFDYARFDLKWAWERLTGTGDYKTGGYFDREGHPWRQK